MRNEDEDRSPATATADHPAFAASPGAEAAPTKSADPGKPAVVEEVVIEEVSIDGMCGVY